MDRKLKVVHYLNQFFGQIGGEEKADTAPLKKDGTVGPGLLFQQLLGQEAEIVGTVICGDNHFNENLETAKEAVLELVKGYRPDLLLAGPAFNAGRYGTACGAVCEEVAGRLAIPAVTGMFPENPGVDLYKKSVYIIETKPSSMGMKDAAQQMVGLALKLAKGESLGSPAEEGYIARGVRKNYFAKERGATRAVDMLLSKMKGEPFVTEYPMPVFDRVEPSPPIEDLSQITLALITSGGIVPKGNPDHVESSSASKYGKYDIQTAEALSPETYETTHGGYDPTYANQDPHRVLPLDVIRDLEREGVIRDIYPYYYATVGNGTSVANAKKFAQEIAKDLLRDGVQAVIISST
ncbi:MAG: beta-aspartate methyltransferase [Nitrospira bacterium SG8_3]|nr:MAG: beta-aspartate methyltransferase [Nitrospira bacterium SG8_3]